MHSRLLLVEDTPPRPAGNSPGAAPRARLPCPASAWAAALPGPAQRRRRTPQTRTVAKAAADAAGEAQTAALLTPGFEMVLQQLGVMLSRLV